MPFVRDLSFRRLSLPIITAAIALTLAPLALPAGTPIVGAKPAEAGHWRHSHRGGDAAAAAVIGGILGLGLGLSIAEPRYYEPYYYGPRPLYRIRPNVRYRHAPRPGSRAWYRYCAAKYRSFDARSGTYQPYHGKRRRCR
ncbi:BA14K family protein [Jiella mangrovi]|uniref:Lectin-like protein BA14k n=1 Tax=Jiella mangrovi TaxID=2821407 RepID=A0ABS4BDE5_9HYPH|nr:BA14K family protein [Jiella mangrovi]MBP0614777.1 BA14K family protein [Jiella mangrovi]